jgi:predicted DNA-binding protein (MmcQ/YjbR family)
MDLEALRAYCFTLPAVTEGMPFGEEVLVFKVANKIFSLADTVVFASVNLKCDPGRAVNLRERYPAIVPGYHMNKVHWNTLMMDGSLPDKLILELACHSYDLIVRALSKKQKADYGLGDPAA